MSEHYSNGHGFVDNFHRTYCNECKEKCISQPSFAEVIFCPDYESVNQAGQEIQRRRKNTYGARIKRRRKKLGWTQARLAKHLGLNSKTTIAKYEKDERQPSKKVIEWLKEAEKK